ncbi:hypothetical protein fugu_004318 [Takifugu bimaculatus]|uniref:Outer dense fiber protein 2 n=1 Tax=Takifugu bimaculatus TaxID=433685 RepID=A0A4Z2BCC9_9TELE|nr:hypothetical protein fugu_004318 [Takifugu bimaculatus]
MKTRESSPPPVHVHVSETTPVHVHMRRTPSKTSQNRTGDAETGGKPKLQKPWIPPGRLSCRRDVGSLKSQRSRVEHQSGSRHQCEEEEQEEEIATLSKNLSALLGDDRDFSKKSVSRGQRRDTGLLLKALVEAEIDGVTVSNHLTALKDTIDSLSKNKRLTSLHAASMRRQQESLLEKIDTFDRTNRSLRDLLREWSDNERESMLWFEEKDALKKRVADYEAENIQLLSQISSMENETSRISEHLELEKDKAKTSGEFSRILQSTQSHLESELSRMETEKTQMVAQMQRMQHNHKQQQEKLKALQEELQMREKEKDERGRQAQEALVLLTQKAERAEESARQFSLKLQEKEFDLAQALSTSSDWCCRHSKEAAAKAQLEEENSALRLQLTELKNQLQLVEEKSRTETKSLMDQLHHLSGENASTNLENQRLKGVLMSSEETLRGLQAEAHQMKSSIKKHDNLVEKYKKKIQQVRLESEEYCVKLEMKQTEMRETKLSLEVEKEQMRQELLGRRRELETMADRLKRTEQQLRDAQQEAQQYERRNEEYSSGLAEVRQKVEQQGAHLETFQQKNLVLQEENSVLKEKIFNLERKLESTKVQNEEISKSLTSKEVSLQISQKQLDEKTYECSVLSRQLQSTLDDARRQVEDNMQKVLTKERTSQSKTLDLQSQLSRAKAEQGQLQRSKEEMERRYQTQLQNMKDRLEQSDSKNRSLQNYVHFLKTSYGNVYADSLHTS